MTKGEFIKALEPFTDEIKIEVIDTQGMSLNIKHADYGFDDEGNGVIALVPMGSHLPKDQTWTRFWD